MWSAQQELRTVCSRARAVQRTPGWILRIEVQELNTNRRLAEGARLVGRKIGLTSVAVQKQLGVDQPDYGMLFADMARADGETVPVSRLIQPKVEGEIAFVLGQRPGVSQRRRSRTCCGQSISRWRQSRLSIHGFRTGTFGWWIRSPTTLRPRCTCWVRSRNCCAISTWCIVEC